MAQSSNMQQDKPKVCSYVESGHGFMGSLGLSPFNGGII
jgi:hypothetical protein